MHSTTFSSSFQNFLSPLLPSLEGSHLCLCNIMASLLTTAIVYHIKREIFPNSLCLISLSMLQVSWDPCAWPSFQCSVYWDPSLNSLPDLRGVWLALSGSHGNRKKHIHVRTFNFQCLGKNPTHTNSVRGSTRDCSNQLLPTPSNCYCPWRTHV